MKPIKKIPWAHSTITKLNLNRNSRKGSPVFHINLWRVKPSNPAYPGLNFVLYFLSKSVITARWFCSVIFRSQSNPTISIILEKKRKKEKSLQNVACFYYLNDQQAQPFTRQTHAVTSYQELLISVGSSSCGLWNYVESQTHLGWKRSSSPTVSHWLAFAFVELIQT